MSGAAPSPRRAGAPARAGTILILVAGISALLASMALVFLVRQRSSAEESSAFEADIQARIMLVAACNYIQEASRLGYDDGIDPFHREAFGWIDVRMLNADGTPMIGPNCRGATPISVVRLYDDALAEVSGLHGSVVDRPAWPAIGGVARCPMQVMNRPPYAVQLTAAYNPISNDPADPAFGRPFQRHPDPLPVVADPSASAASLDQYRRGDPLPRPESSGRSWFRVYRDGPDTFVITCGAGATAGFTCWQEVLGAQGQALFGGDPAQFQSYQDQEVRLWYRVQWSPAVATADTQNIKNAWEDGVSSEDYYVSFPMNSSQSIRSQSHCKNLGGTFRWIERLRVPPTRY